MDIELRSPTTDAELAAFYEPLASAFYEEISEGERAAEQPLMELDRLINAFDGDRRIASSGAFSMTLTVPGGAEVKAAGITAVGVAPDARRRGILRRMMDWHVADAARRGEPLAILWASEAAIYQRFGFGCSTRVSSFEADTARLRFRDPLPAREDVRFRMLEVEEAAAVGPRVYAAARGRRPGTISRPEAMWRNLLMGDGEWMRGGNGPKFRVVLEVRGEPVGYAVYRVRGEYSPRGPANVVSVLECIGVDAEIEQRLWQWLATMDLAVTLTGRRGPVPHPLELWVEEPRRLGMSVGDGLWLRFLDVGAALGARQFTGEGHLVLELADPLLPANAGRWSIDASASGAARVSRTEAAADLRLDVGALACVYLGAFRFADLVAAGRARECRPGAALAADVLFLTAEQPHANTMF